MTGGDFKGLGGIVTMTEFTADRLLLFGATGDLARRKLLPSLCALDADGLLPADLKIIGTARSDLDDAAYVEMARKAINDFLSEARRGDVESFLKRLSYQSLDATTLEGFTELAAKVGTPNHGLAIFLSTAPSLFGPTIAGLEHAGLTGETVRIGLEKPLGVDLQSSCAINDAVATAFSEEQIFRIDHYLGKETVQNLLALRFANILFEPIWNSNYISHVQITVAETVGVGGRASYYDQYGAIRDMVQNHLLQLVCLVAMEPPAKFNANQVRDEKLRVLRALRPLEADALVLGQYEDYTEELGTSSNTETYVAMKLAVDNWRWAGVPFYIRTGKKLQQRASEIIITFKDRPHDIFSSSGDRKILGQPNRLIIRLQPSEGLRLQMTSKQPGPGGMRLFPSDLNLSFDETFEERLPDAYERLLMDTARGNQTLFMRVDEVLAAWAFIDPVLALAETRTPLSYRAGSMGPKDDLLESDGRSWIDPHEDW